MRHRKQFRKYSRNSSHRKAMFANLAMALIESGRITTTDAKAKDLRRVAEKLVTLAKKGTLDAKRRAHAELGGAGKHKRTYGREPSRVERSVESLFGSLAERFKDRPGGYTRVLKLGNRHGDNAPMSIIEFIGYEPQKAQDPAEEDTAEA